MGHAFADRLDRAGCFHTDPAGRLDRIVARTKVRIGKVAAHGRVADPHFAGAGAADFDIFDLQDFRSARRVETYSLGHGLCSPKLFDGS